jgi:glycosyltransferase involved in cell wall biosynthesis
MADKLLTIGYSTLADRVKNIVPSKMDLPHEIFISIQNPSNIDFALPTNFEFNSVTTSEKGVTKSRNTVLRSTRTKYLLFADDDIAFIGKGIESAVSYLEAHPNCDLVLAQVTDANGTLRKDYPTREEKLTRFNSAKAGTIEMIVRVDSIRSKRVNFDENFGAGADNYLGDEYIFITDLLKAGGSAIFLPITIAIHSEDSSGSRWGTESDLRARARVFQRVFGFTAPLIRTAFVFKNFQKFAGTKNLYKFIFGKL